MTDDPFRFYDNPLIARYAGAIASLASASIRVRHAHTGLGDPHSGYLQRTGFVYTRAEMTAALPDLDLAELIADTEGEIVRLVQDRDPSTHGLYEMVRRRCRCI